MRCFRRISRENNYSDNKNRPPDCLQQQPWCITISSKQSMFSISADSATFSNLQFFVQKLQNFSEIFSTKPLATTVIKFCKLPLNLSRCQSYDTDDTEVRPMFHQFPPQWFRFRTIVNHRKSILCWVQF